MHLAGFLPEGEDDREASLRAASRGVEAPPISAFSTRPSAGSGLVLGFAAFGVSQIAAGAKALADALADRTPRRPESRRANFG
jgi:GntR family transcriptional regulator/MocR family aminotransferase